MGLCAVLLPSLVLWAALGRAAGVACPVMTANAYPTVVNPGDMIYVNISIISDTQALFNSTDSIFLRARLKGSGYFMKDGLLAADPPTPIPTSVGRADSIGWIIPYNSAHALSFGVYSDLCGIDPKISIILVLKYQVEKGSSWDCKTRIPLKVI